MMPSPDVTINSRKYDHTIRRSWQARLIETDGSLLVFVGVFAQAVHHPDLGHILAGTVSYEYYWLDRWYNVFRFHEPDGTFRNWYCNINMPPTFEGGVLDYVDLDIDILIWPGKEPIVLDEDEFEENAALFAYSQDVITGSRNALAALQRDIKTEAFPFSEKK
ncbi:MAG TPA: DUF402 domain-containing protein [Pyrinomonadaceae bacterium]|nr:DUF402 domain-containing protein [Pyrinomonadaceae bacterium]